MLEVTHSMDMQIPTFLMGDFNGSCDPARDFRSTSGQRRAACPLLVQLLGPGAAWVDVHANLLDTPPWTFQSVETGGQLSASRIDLVLANHVAMGLVKGATVLEQVRDGGHSPVVVDVCLGNPGVMTWQCPRPRLPPLLRLSSTVLRCSPEWQDLVERWLQSRQVAPVLDESLPQSATSLSDALVGALQHLVRLAGGWATRPPNRRPAYDSDELRAARRVLANLNSLFSLLQRHADGAPGCWPRSCGQLLRRLADDGLQLSDGPA